MIKCPFCGAEQVPNTIFCSECGVYLVDDQSRGTEILDLDEVNLDDEYSHQDGTNANNANDQEPLICLKIGNQSRQIETRLTKAVHLGRLDPTSDVFPEIDLTDDNGLENGVSRRHARISKKDSHIIIEDLGSINGTFVNGKRLAPYLGEALKSGDQLQLGNLIIEINLG